MNPTPLWQLDSRLAGILSTGGKLELLSVDVFDTLLLRRCGNPAEVFVHAARRALQRGALARGVSPQAFRELRVRAEARARACHAPTDVDLRTIYDWMPKRLGDPAILARCEIEADADLVYLNPAVDSLLEQLGDAGVPLALVSNTYYPEDDLKQILAVAGFDTSRVALVLSSCQHGRRKQDGLFEQLREAYPNVAPQSVVHLGDNRQTDVIAARQARLQAHSYEPNGDLDQLFDWEQLHHADGASSLRALRRLAGHLSGERRGDDLAAFRLGAMVLGPVLAGFADWVVETCRQEGVSHLWGIMREGGLLASLVQESARSEGLDLQVQAAYLSRQSTACAAITELDDGALEAIARRREYRVGDLLRQFGLDETDIVWNSRSDEYLSDLMQVEEEGGYSAWDVFKLELLQGDWRRRAERHLAQERRLLKEYLDSLAPADARVATLDLGWGGTIQRALHRLRESPDLHLLMCGARASVNALEEGLDLRCCYGTVLGGETAPLIRDLLRSAYLVEHLLTGSSPTTLGYRRVAEGVEPVLGAPAKTSRDARICAHIEQGVKAFQRLCLEVESSHHVGDARARLALLHRLIDLPTPEEAALLGRMQIELNFGSETKVRVCPEDTLELARSHGPEWVLDSGAGRLGTTRMQWPSGCITQLWPDYLAGQRLRLGAGEGYLAAMLALARCAKVKNFRKLAIYGAGQVGSAFVRAASLVGLRPALVIDGNEYLWGTSFHGLPVDSLPRVLKQDVDCVVICSFAHTAAMAAAVRRESPVPEILLPDAV